MTTAARRCFLAVVLTAAASLGHAQLTFHWQERFAAAEQAQLVAWIEDTHAALERLVGPLPFDVDVHLHRRDRAREPVPWAHTQRYRRQGVHFHVDPAYPPDAFRRDWTAAHELSHLILPYLGSRHAWFAEGFASYMQYQVMLAMDVLSPAEAARRYRHNLERAERSYAYSDKPFAAAAPRLRAEQIYPTMYWGGAAYFLQVDTRLRETGDGDLVEVLRRYLACCHRARASLAALVTELDRAAGTRVFAEQLEQFQTRPGFPDWRPAVRP